MNNIFSIFANVGCLIITCIQYFRCSQPVMEYNNQIYMRMIILGHLMSSAKGFIGIQTVTKNTTQLTDSYEIIITLFPAISQFCIWQELTLFYQEVYLLLRIDVLNISPQKCSLSRNVTTQTLDYILRLK